MSKDNITYNSLITLTVIDDSLITEAITDDSLITDSLTESSPIGIEDEVSPIPSGAVAYYPFNGNANDESGNDNDGIVTGAILTEDGYTFASTADYIDCGNSDSLNIREGAFSAAFYIEYDSEIRQAVMAKIDAGSPFRGWICELISGNGTFNFKFLIRDTLSAVMQVHSNTGNIPTGRTHLAVTWDGTDASGVVMYVNKVPVAIRILNDAPVVDISTTSNFTLGNNGTPGGLYLDGTLGADVLIYNRVLTPEEITSLP